tara:strand:- start:1293 stop:2027 length:735 start_codon:yes stop_codon:yes gene_type:complete
MATYFNESSYMPRNINREDQSAYNPTNPNQYNFNWSGSNIAPYIQEGNVPTDPNTYTNQLGFLSDQGIQVSDLDDASLAYLPSMDRITTAYNRMNTNVGMARTGLGFDMDAQRLSGQSNLLGMTGGQGLSSIGGGFGRAGTNMFSNIRNANRAYQTGLNQSMAGFQSDILGMQYDYQDAMTDYTDALTQALGNIAASGEDDFTIRTGAAPTVNPDIYSQDISNMENLEGSLRELMGFDPNNPYG